MLIPSRRVRPTAVAGIALLASTLVLAAGGPGVADTTPPAVHARSAAALPVLHRVVWDRETARSHGIHLYSANVDGSGVRRIYAARRGFVLDLILDRRGRRVAFAPCCQKQAPLLVVVPVLGGRARRPLADHPEFYFVGGIGWSPSGRRLVFEGNTRTGTHLHSALWTVGVDGTGLRRLLRLPPPRSVNGGYVNPALAWTRSGVLYSDGDDLRIASHQTSHLVLLHVESVRISGNGRHVLTTHVVNFRASLWYGNTDGTDQHRLYLYPKDNATTYAEATPNFGGSRILAWREQSTPDGTQDDVVWWNQTADPATATTIPVAGSNVTVTWN